MVPSPTAGRPPDRARARFRLAPEPGWRTHGRDPGGHHRPADRPHGHRQHPPRHRLLPRANAGSSGQLRVNGLYEVYRSTSLAHDKVDRKALKRFSRDIGAALKIEIDYYALIRFDGFSQLVDKLGGIDVQIKQQIVDDYYRTPSGLRGAYFPVANSWHLTGNPPCKPYPKKCHNSLAYARSRHGTVGTGYNTDFARARRQQQLILDGSQKVVTNGLDALAGLVSAAKGRVYTNLPMTLDAATQLFAIAQHATLSPDDMMVFSPSRWALVAARDPAYSFELRASPTVRPGSRRTSSYSPTTVTSRGKAVRRSRRRASASKTTRSSMRTPVSLSR